MLAVPLVTRICRTISTPGSCLDPGRSAGDQFFRYLAAALVASVDPGLRREFLGPGCSAGNQDLPPYGHNR